MIHPKLVEMYKTMRAAHRQMVEIDALMEREITSSISKEDDADSAYALREIAKFADDTRKRCEKLKRLAEKMAVMISLTEGSADSIRTDHCTASIKMRTVVTVPNRNRNPAEYVKLMEWLGVPEHFWKGRPEPIVETYWPGLIEYLCEQLADGKPLPPGIDPNKTYPEYSLVCTKRKGVAEDDENAATNEDF